MATDVKAHQSRDVIELLILKLEQHPGVTLQTPRFVNICYITVYFLSYIILTDTVPCLFRFAEMILNCVCCFIVCYCVSLIHALNYGNYVYFF